MRRVFAFSLLACGLLFAVALPATAQTSGSSSSSYGTPPPIGEGDASVGSASPTDVNPGDPVTFSTGNALGDCTSADVVFVRGLQDSTGIQITENQPVTNGSLTTQFQVPQVPAGIYFIYATCTDSAGNVLQAVSVVVVFTAESPTTTVAAASDGSASAQAQAAPSTTVATPAAVAALQTTPNTEQALLAAATTPGASLGFINGQLAVSHRPADNATATTVIPVLSIALAALAVLGLTVFAYRRRAAKGAN